MLNLAFLSNSQVTQAGVYMNDHTHAMSVKLMILYVRL